MKLRSKLDKLSVLELQGKLKKLAPEKLNSLNSSDAQNKRRLIRAIEIGRVGNHKSRTKNYDSLVIGLYCERENLKQRIDARIEKRLKQGALEEAKVLFGNYSNLTPQVKSANGYKQLFAFLKDETSFEEAIECWKISEYRHAKSQMTWFRKYGNVIWFDIMKKNFENTIESSLKGAFT